VETNIRKNLALSDTLYVIASDEASRKKVVQVALKTLFRLKKERPEKDFTIKISSIEELRKSKFNSWFELKI